MHASSFSVLFSLFLSASLSLAGPVFITQPTHGTTWQAGQQVMINWQGKDGDSATLTNAPITFELVHGDPNAVQNLGQLAIACAEKAGRVTFKLPEDLPTSNLYGIKTGANTYSPQFTIQGKSAFAGTFPPLTPYKEQCGQSGVDQTAWNAGVMLAAAAAGTAVMLA